MDYTSKDYYLFPQYLIKDIVKMQLDLSYYTSNNFEILERVDLSEFIYMYDELKNLIQKDLRSKILAVELAKVLSKIFGDTDK